MSKKICIVTGTRAEYGLFYPLMKKLKDEHAFDLQVIAAGMHVSPEFGSTYREIEADGFHIHEKVEMLLSSDTAAGTGKSIGLGVILFAEVFGRMKPDLLIVLGDRFETFAATVSAFIAGVPIAHLHGGEVTEGAFDDSLRHSITKMSHLHFTAAAPYAQRVVQLGEAPERVFTVGALGVDTIKDTPLLSKAELEQEINFAFRGKTALVTYHPVTLERDTAGSQFRNLLKAFDAHQDLRVIFTHPNADTDGRVIVRLITEYVKENPGRTMSCVSLGKVKYLSALHHVDVVVGNSSSGIIEAPSFQKPAVNIGDRQKGRLKAGSVIDCAPESEAIAAAVQKALSHEFRSRCLSVINPYGDGNAAERIVEILRSGILDHLEAKKGFFDLHPEGDVHRVHGSCEPDEVRNAREKYINC